MRRRSGFTLVELIAVIVVLAILAGFALPKYFDYSDNAKTAADEAAIGGIRTALNMAHLDHRVNNTPSGQWVDAVADIPALMESGQLPSGIEIVGASLRDQRGNTYNITAETASAPATLTKVGGGGS